jgi:methionine-rich copper-binding protein CopC
MQTTCTTRCLGLVALLSALAAQAWAQPTITTVSPAPNRQSAPRTSSITTAFSQPLNAGSAAALRVFSAQHGGQRAGNGGTTTVNGNQLVFTPGSTWKPGETVRATITNGVQNTSGHPLASARVFEFTAATGGTGLGSFSLSPAPTGTISISALKMQLADVDGDGDLDLISANTTYLNYSRFPLSIRLNNGQGVFSGGSDVRITRASNGADHLAVGDVDGDGDIDILTTNSRDSVNLRFNDGNGSFQTGYNVLVNANSIRPNDLSLADIDGDGDLDLLAYTLMQPAYTGQLSVRLNDGTGQFGGGYDEPLGQSNYGCHQTADIDGDGDLDLIITSIRNRTSVRFNNGSGVFSAGYQLPEILYASDMQLGDLDGDGDVDLTILDENGPGALVTYRNNGAGTFTRVESFSMFSNPYKLSLSDVDADGDLDMVVGNRGGTSVHFNNGQGIFPGYSLSTTMFGLAIGDVDGDNDVDMVSQYPSSPTIAAYSLATWYNQPAAPVLSTGNPQRAAQVTLHPNPARQQCTLTVPNGFAMASAVVVNALGQCVMTVSLPATAAAYSTTIDVTDLPPGIYTVLLSTGTENIAKRLVKE